MFRRLNTVRWGIHSQFGSCLKYRTDFHENFITNVTLDRKDTVKFWKSFGYAVQTLDKDFRSGPRPEFTDDLRTILRHFSDLQQSYDNWRIYRKYATMLRPV